MKYIYIACIACFAYLQAGLEEHFKPALNKGGNHTIQNIDFIYMINLDERPEKFQESATILEKYGIYPYRFSAVNGWNLTLEEINDVGVKFAPGMNGKMLGTSYFSLEPTHGIVRNFGQVYFCHCMARGPIGIVLSHLSILQDAYDSGYETIWVMEDDIEIQQNPHIVSKMITLLDKRVGKKGWDILFTDRDTRNKLGEYVPCTSAALKPFMKKMTRNNPALRKRIDKNFMKIGARYGVYSMIVRRSGMKKILDYMKATKIFLPYDMEILLVPNIQQYAVINNIVAHKLDAKSDNGGPNYLVDSKKE